MKPTARDQLEGKRKESTRRGGTEGRAARAAVPKSSRTTMLILRAIAAGPVYVYGLKVIEITGLPSGTVYPKPVHGAFNIGLLHTCLEDGGTDYAPASIEKLTQHGYEYWALGHIHQRQDLSRDGVHIEFPGNLQGRSCARRGLKAARW